MRRNKNSTENCYIKSAKMSDDEILPFIIFCGLMVAVRSLSTCEHFTCSESELAVVKASF
jgi:hypothetical protein